MDAPGADHSRPARLLRHLPLAAILAVALIGTLTLGDALSYPALAARHEELAALRDGHYLLTALAFLAFYTLIVAFSLPGAAVTSIAGGFLFGMFPGTPFNVVAATAGATLIFLAARWGAGGWLSRRMDTSEGRVKRLKAAIDANQWEALFLMRLIPIVPFFLANLLPAVFGVPLRRFVISTFLGIIPGALVFTSIGAGLSELLARGEAPDLGVIFTPPLLLPILGLAALAALPIIIKSVRGRAL